MLDDLTQTLEAVGSLSEQHEASYAAIEAGDPEEACGRLVQAG